MAALRSRTDPLLACQLGSAVSVALAAVTRARPMAWLECPDTPVASEETDFAGLLLLLLLLGSWKWPPRLRAFGEASGDDEGEQGWVICMFSRCCCSSCCCGWCCGPAGELLKLMLCGGEAGPLLRVSSAKARPNTERERVGVENRWFGDTVIGLLEGMHFGETQ